MAINNTDQRKPYVGQPASIVLYTDTRAAVVTRVTPKTIVIARVETAEPRLDMASDAGAYGLRPTLENGILDKPIEGTEQRFTWNERRQGWFHMGTRVRLGLSITRIDHRF